MPTETAFQANAFENDAFQINVGPAPNPPASLVDTYVSVLSVGGAYESLSVGGAYESLSVGGKTGGGGT